MCILPMMGLIPLGHQGILMLSLDLIFHDLVLFSHVKCFGIESYVRVLLRSLATGDIPTPPALRWKNAVSFVSSGGASAT